MQKLLAHSFRRRAYWVISNAVGVPDFVAVRPGNMQGYAVEVKTATGRKLNLKDRELQAVTMSDHYPVVAVLLFPNLDPRWLCLDAHALRPGALDTMSLVRMLLVRIDFDLNGEFRAVLADFHEAAMTGSYALDHAIEKDTVPV
jgi:hypothetical protein